MKRRFPWSTLLLLVVCGGLVSVIARAVLAGPPTVPRKADIAVGQREEKPSVGADERVPLPAGDLISGNGLVEPAEREVKVAAQVGGVVAEFRVKEGQFVQKGDVLAVLAGEVERAAVATAQAELQVARAEVRTASEDTKTALEDMRVTDEERVRTERGLRAEDVQAAVAEAESAKARAALSAGALRRTTAARQGGAATEDELDRARKQAEIDLRAANAALARASAAKAGSRPEDIVVARGKVSVGRARVAAAKVKTSVTRTRIAVSEAKLAQAKAQAERLIVRAPAAGEVLQLKFRVGEYYNPGGGEPLLILGDTRKLRVRMDVYERDLGKLKLGAPGYVISDAFPGQRFPGRVVELGRRMGRKNFRTDDPVERIDTKILEVVLELERSQGLVPGLRLMAYLEPPTQVPAAK